MIDTSGLRRTFRAKHGEIEAVAGVDPAVDATCVLVNGHVWDGDVLRGLLIMIGCAAVAVTVATRRFRRAAA